MYDNQANQIVDLSGGSKHVLMSSCGHSLLHRGHRPKLCPAHGQTRTCYLQIFHNMSGSLWVLGFISTTRWGAQNPYFECQWWPSQAGVMFRKSSLANLANLYCCHPRDRASILGGHNTPHTKCVSHMGRQKHHTHVDTKDFTLCDY